MKKCEKCNKEHDETFGSGRFCSRSCANSRIQTEEMNKRRREKLLKREIRYCKECNKELSPKTKGEICKLCSIKNKLSRSQSNLNWRKRKRKKLIQEFGNKCIKCGYNKCTSALHFHHLDEFKKKFNVNNGCVFSFQKMEKEAKKCILVCANCHAEIHNGYTDI